MQSSQKSQAINQQRPGCNLFSSFFKVRTNSIDQTSQTWEEKQQETSKPPQFSSQKTQSEHQEQYSPITQQICIQLSTSSTSQQPVPDSSSKHSKHLSLSQITNQIYKVPSGNIPPLPYSISKKPSNTSISRASVQTTRISLNESNFQNSNETKPNQLQNSNFQKNSIHLTNNNRYSNQSEIYSSNKNNKSYNNQTAADQHYYMESARGSVGSWQTGSIDGSKTDKRDLIESARGSYCGMQSLDRTHRETSVIQNYKEISQNFIRETFKENSKEAINQIIKTRLQIDEQKKYKFQDERSSSNNRNSAKPPKASVPFVVFKSEKPLTSFKEFKLSTNERSLSRGRNRMNSEQSYRENQTDITNGSLNSLKNQCKHQDMDSKTLQDEQLPPKPSKLQQNQDIANSNDFQPKTGLLLDYFKKFSTKQISSNIHGLR